MSEFHMFENSSVAFDSLDFRIVIGANIASGETKSIEPEVNSFMECRTSTFCEARINHRSGGYGVHLEWEGISYGLGVGYGGLDVTRNLFSNLFITGATSWQNQGQVNIMWKVLDSDGIGFAIGPSIRKQNYEILYNSSAGERTSRFIPSEHLLPSSGIRVLSLVRVNAKSMPFILRSSLFVGRLNLSNRYFATFGLNLAFD